MAKVNYSQLYAKAVEEVFIESWPGFAEQSASDRAHLVVLMTSALRCGKYKHNVYEDHVSYYCRTRDQHFGVGGFQRLNAALKLFEVAEHWLVGSHTKGYRLTTRALFLMESVPLRTTALVDTDGKNLKTPATNAVFEKDIKGNHRRGRGQLPAVVSVDIEEMIKLLHEARQWRWHFKDNGKVPESRRLEARLSGMADDRQRIDWLTSYLVAPLTLTILRADTAHLPKGRMEILYNEFPSGRLYAVAGLMQTAPREVRNAAFREYWDYDLENCHFSLIAQLAARVGKPTPAINNYLLHKREIRNQIAHDLNVPVKAVKQALIALIYGASRRVNSFYKNNKEVEPAIVRIMGDKTAALLFEHPLYDGLLRELRTVRGPVIASMKVNRGRIINPFGKGIDKKETPEAVLAHVIQGSEAAALDAVLQTHGEHIRLCMHDGWVSAVKLDIPALKDMIREKTGFEVEIEESQLN